MPRGHPYDLDVPVGQESPRFLSKRRYGPNFAALGGAHVASTLLGGRRCRSIHCRRTGASRHSIRAPNGRKVQCGRPSPYLNQGGMGALTQSSGRWGRLRGPGLRLEFHFVCDGVVPAYRGRLVRQRRARVFVRHGTTVRRLHRRQWRQQLTRTASVSTNERHLSGWRSTSAKAPNGRRPSASTSWPFRSTAMHSARPRTPYPACRRLESP